VTIKHLNISWEAYQKIMAYVQCADGEVSGFGKSGRGVLGNMPSYTMLDAKIFKQTCGASSTELDMNALSQFICDLDKQGESVRQWRIWWHSHADFSVFWSAIDEATIKKLSAKVHLISLCINKLGEMTARMDVGGRKVLLTVVLVPPCEGGVFRDCQQEVKDKIKTERVRHYGRVGKGKDEEVVLEAAGFGESREDSFVQSYGSGRGSDWEFRDVMSVEDGMLQYYGI
jgi:hypothetical protein